MSVEISGAPTPVSGPGFPGLTVSVPLSEVPTEVWLDLFALEDLPGKGHRLNASTLEFHLDRDSHDVVKSMDAIQSAIDAANQKYDEAGAQLEAGSSKAGQRSDAVHAKTSRLLEEWYERQRPSESAAGETAIEAGTTSS